MAHLDVYTRTAKGMLEMRNRASALPPELQQVLRSIEGLATLKDVSARLRLGDRTVQHAVQQLHSGGYIQPAAMAHESESDLDFSSPGAISRLQAQAEARTRAEAAARARAEQARRDAEAAQLREQEQAHAQAEAQAQAVRAAQARGEAQAAARAADEERIRAAQQARTAQSPASKAAAQARMEAAMLAEAHAAAEARELQSAESAARATVAQTQDSAARARKEAHAHARAESEAQARAHAEAHARAMVEAQLKAMGAALARAQALARDEANARARLTADLQAREAAEAQARADAASRARADAEAQMHAELSRLREEAQQALEVADARAEAERQAREAAEALAEQERAARGAAEAQAHAQLEAQRRAHAAARAATQARVEEERAARVAAESRAQAEAEARLAHESSVHAGAEDRVRVRVAEEIRAREAAERAADAEYRAEAARRARLAAAAAAAEQPPAQERGTARRRPLDAAAVAMAAGGAALALAAGAALVLPMVPLDGYVPGVEQAAADLLRQPVRIGRMQYSLLPAPELSLERVAIGATYSSRAERIVISAWPWELGGAPLRLDAVTVNGAVVEHDGLAALAALLPSQSAGARLERLVLQNARVTVQDVEFPVSAAAIQFHRAGGVRSMRIESGGATLQAAPAPAGAWKIALDARNWQPPLGPAVRFESLSVNGVMDNRRLTNARMEGRIAGGELRADISADWRDGVRAEGGFQITQARLEALLPAYTSHFTARGTLHAEGRYLLQAPTLGKLAGSPRVTADFRVQSGELANVDVVQALRQVSSKGVQGGLTRFEQLSGTLEVAGDRYRYRKLNLVSGPMSAAGDVEVAPGNRLAGRVAADVQASSRTAIRGLLTVSGTLTNPVLRP